MKCYVYGLRAKDSKLYFYIGSTKHSVEYRFKQHFDYARLGYNNNRHFVNKAAKIGWDNIVADTLVECSDVDRFEIEYDLIQKLSATGHPLTNIIYSATHYQPVRKAESHFDDFVLKPYHFVTMFDAYVYGLERNGDTLHDSFCDVIEKLSQNLLEGDLETYLEMFKEALDKADHEQEVNRQAASVYKRISQVLERC